MIGSMASVSPQRNSFQLCATGARKICRLIPWRSLHRKPEFSERSLNDPESVVGSSAVCSSAVGTFNVAAFCSDEECELSEDVFGDVEVAEASGVADGLEGFAFVVGESVVDG